MANAEHVDIFKRGISVWNEWRQANPSIAPDLSGAKCTDLELARIDFHEADLAGADFSNSFLGYANLRGAGCTKAIFRNAILTSALGDEADFTGAVLESAYLGDGSWQRTTFREVAAIGVDFRNAKMLHADLTEFFTHGGSFFQANASYANFSRAYIAWCDAYDGEFVNSNFADADFEGSDFHKSNLSGAVMTRMNLKGAIFRSSNLRGADLTHSDLSAASLVGTDIRGANLSRCRIHGVSTWDLKVDEFTRQEGMIITPADVPAVVIDDVEVAQFIYLLLNNSKIRNVIDTVGAKGVLILGRFTERMQVLDAIRTALRDRGYLPIVFDFGKPTDRDFTETVKILAGLSRFVIAEITRPKSVPLEAQATIPDYMVPFVPIIEQGEQPFSMFQNLWLKYGKWVLEPLAYRSVDQLLNVFDKAVVNPANERLRALRSEKATAMAVRDASQYES